MAIYPGKTEPQSCVYCQKAITKGQRRHFSWQVGMKGHYHWDCFVVACKEANSLGSRIIETITEGVYAEPNSYDIFSL